MPGALPVVARAKLNLGLRVHARRADGLHEIESLFLPLALADRVVLRPLPRGVVLRCAGPEDAPRGRANLALRAAEAFFEAAQLAHGASAGVEIQLEKHIPSPAGLGGASSDAGAVLRGLSQLHPRALAPARLRALAFALGADVPFFLAPGPALVEGAGERVLPLAGLPALHLALVLPARRLATPEVFEAFAEARASAARSRASNPAARVASSSAREDAVRPRSGAASPREVSARGRKEAQPRSRASSRRNPSSRRREDAAPRRSCNASPRRREDAEQIRSCDAPRRAALRTLLNLQVQRDAATARVPSFDARQLFRAGLLENDLEPVATRLCPELATLRAQLEATRALAVGMSGSGPAMYAVFAGAKPAHAAARSLARGGWQSRAVQTTPSA